MGETIGFLRKSEIIQSSDILNVVINQVRWTSWRFPRPNNVNPAQYCSWLINQITRSNYFVCSVRVTPVRRYHHPTGVYFNNDDVPKSAPVSEQCHNATAIKTRRIESLWAMIELKPPVIASKILGNSRTTSPPVPPWPRRGDFTRWTTGNVRRLGPPLSDSRRSPSVRARQRPGSGFLVQSPRWTLAPREERWAVI